LRSSIKSNQITKRIYFRLPVTPKSINPQFKKKSINLCEFQRRCPHLIFSRPLPLKSQPRKQGFVSKSSSRTKQNTGETFSILVLYFFPLLSLLNIFALSPPPSSSAPYPPPPPPVPTRRRPPLDSDRGVSTHAAARRRGPPGQLAPAPPAAGQQAFVRRPARPRGSCLHVFFLLGRAVPFVRGILIEFCFDVLSLGRLEI
jgi:hypothetical protein